MSGDLMSGDPCICGDKKTWHQECYRRALAPQAAEPFYVVQAPTGEYETWLYVSRASAERAAERRGEPGYLVLPLYLAARAPQAAEPAAWIDPRTLDGLRETGFLYSVELWRESGARADLVPLYLAPQAPAAQPLTRNEIEEIAGPGDYYDRHVVARAIERAVWAKCGIAPSAQGEK